MLISSYILRLGDGVIPVLNVAIVLNLSNYLPLTSVYGRVMFGWLIIILMALGWFVQGFIFLASKCIASQSLNPLDISKLYKNKNGKSLTRINGHINK